MALLEKKLKVKASNLPGAGKGLFAKEFISKGTRIVEYKGKITTWKEVDDNDGNNGYIYYVKRNHVIDASRHNSALARYANDAKGLTKVEGIKNNCCYEIWKNRSCYFFDFFCSSKRMLYRMSLQYSGP